MRFQKQSGFVTRQRIARVLLTAVVLSLTVVAPASAATSAPNAGYGGPYFGADNIPPGCEGDMEQGTPEYWYVEGEGGLFGGSSSSQAVCHHMRSDMNGLDSPEVDVLVLVPATAQPERDARLARQVIHMYDGGIDMLAPQMGMDWLADGMNFHVTVDTIDPTGDDGGEFTTYPIYDPEIVVVMGANPPATFGIGIDPIGLNFCHGVQNPFDLEMWEALPGFDSHHEGRDGIYNEDCGGAGGNICYSINTTFDTTEIAFDSMFDLVAHEVGHCLTIGHVGDGAEGAWGGLPPDDIMAYSEGGPGTKCLSTLDVEGMATVMSRYLDTNGDGVITAEDELLANDRIGEGGNPFQVQHPRDHFYASTTGKAIDCPQPDSGILPGPRVDWTPEFQGRYVDVLEITAPADGTENQSGDFTVTGTVEHQPIGDDGPATTVSQADAAGDTVSPTADYTNLTVQVTDTQVIGTATLTALDSADDPASVQYRFVIEDQWFDTNLSGGQWVTRHEDSSQGATAESVVVDEATAVVDTEAGTITWTVERDYLADFATEAPYDVAAWTYTGLGLSLRDDLVPDSGTFAVHAPADSATVSLPDLGAHLETETRTLEHDGEWGNNFITTESTLGSDMLGYEHHFALDLPSTSDVVVTLEWTQLGAQTSDLDLYMTGPNVDASSGDFNALTAPFEQIAVEGIKGLFDITVDPYLVTDTLGGVDYTLTVQITTEVAVDTDGDGVLDPDDRCVDTFGTTVDGCPDSDGDGVADDLDSCPDMAGTGADGCPVAAIEHVEVYAGDVLLGSDDVDTVEGPDAFSVDVTLPDGTHDLRVDWVGPGGVIVSDTVTVTHDVDDDDDGVANADDQCPGYDDAIDVDGDGIPDDCDDLIDSDGDGVADDEDQCIGHDDTVDTDGDGLPDACDPDNTTGSNGEGSADGQYDRDGDGVTNDVDNCDSVANPDQADTDDDGQGDACDADIDGDGHSNGREDDLGTDKYDPTSYPVKGVHYGPAA